MRNTNHKCMSHGHVAGFTATCLALVVACTLPVVVQGQEAQVTVGLQTSQTEEAQTRYYVQAEEAEGDSVASDAAAEADVANELVGTEEGGIPSEEADATGTTGTTGTTGDDMATGSGVDGDSSEAEAQEEAAPSSDVPAGQGSSEGKGATSSKEEADEKGDAQDARAEEKDTASAKTSKAPKVDVVSVVFVGPDYEWARVSGIELEDGATAWDASEVALERSGMAYETGTEVADDVLVSLARSEEGEVYGSDPSLGSGWHLYVNGEHYEGSASTYVLEDGDELAWHYELGTITVSVSVVGPGGTGEAYWIAPTNVNVAATQSAWDASHVVFEQNGFGDGRLLSYRVAEDGTVELDSLASLGSNGVTGESWRVYVNGVECEDNVAQLQLHAGDSICWYYAGNGTSELPTFAERTGAASQSPATLVHIEGAVAQEWEQDVEEDGSLGDVLAAATGVGVSGGDGVRSIVASRPLQSALPGMAGNDAWSGSLSHLLDDKLYTGQGGRAAWGVDGSLYYFSGLGSVVKLTAS
ncbi:MAG: DUF4430 domain-containing protein [Atopobiaceae bacterium]|nr:DUF4430 domain-containing protein [Atopobiaceae bacterium]